MNEATRSDLMNMGAYAARILARGGEDGRLRLLRDLVRLRLRRSLRRRRTEGLRRDRVLGMPVSFVDYGPLLATFAEVFVLRVYDFTSETDAPFVVDAGANVGLATLFFKRRHPGARVLAFEPEPAAFAALTRNVEENRLEGVRLVNAALGASAGTQELYSEPASLLSSTLGTRGLGRTVTVDRVPLSEHLDEPVDLLKIDVEGAEGEVLLELERSGKLALVRRIALEYHHHFDPGHDAFSELLALLERNGFGYQLDARLAAPVTPGEFQDVLVHAYRKA